MREELGVSLAAGQVRRVHDRLTVHGVRRHVFYAEWADTAADFALEEGLAFRWFTLEEVRSLTDLAPGARIDLGALVEQIGR
jgi:hypothetical protein